MQYDATIPTDSQSPPWPPTTKAIVAVILLVLLGSALFTFRIVIVPLVVGTSIAYVFRPVVRFIRRVTQLSRPAVAALVYLILLGLVILAVVLLIPIIVTQLLTLQRELVGFMRYLNTVSPDTTVQIMELELSAEVLAAEVNLMITNLARSLASGSLTLARGLAETILLAVFTLLISFYVTRDAGKFLQLFEDLVPLAYRQDAQLMLREIDKVWSAFFRGQVILSLVVTVILSTLSAILGLPHPLWIGLLGGLLEFLPSIGHVIWGATAVTIALVAGSTHLPVSDVTFGLIVFAAYALFTQLDINFLIPNIIGKHVDLHPMVVILGIIIGAIAGGVLGVVLAAPTIASLRVVGRYIYAKLFGMNPFPMVGPPSVPWQERRAEAERRAALETEPKVLPGGFFGQRRRKSPPNRPDPPLPGACDRDGKNTDAGR